MSKKLSMYAIVAILSITPVAALAQNSFYDANSGVVDYTTTGGGSQGPVVPTGGSQNLAGLISIIEYYLSEALFLLMALAVVMFVWYVIKYFIKADAERAAAGQYVLYSIIGFFVILSLWGIVNILGNSFGIGNAGNTTSSLSNLKNLFPH